MTERRRATVGEREIKFLPECWATLFRCLHKYLSTLKWTKGNRDSMDFNNGKLVGVRAPGYSLRWREWNYNNYMYMYMYIIMYAATVKRR